MYMYIKTNKSTTTKNKHCVNSMAQSIYGKYYCLVLAQKPFFYCIFKSLWSFSISYIAFHWTFLNNVDKLMAKIFAISLSIITQAPGLKYKILSNWISIVLADALATCFYNCSGQGLKEDPPLIMCSPNMPVLSSCNRLVSAVVGWWERDWHEKDEFYAECYLQKAFSFWINEWLLD